MEHPSTWLVAERIHEARERAREDQLARVARRARGSRSLRQRIRGVR